MFEPKSLRSAGLALSVLIGAIALSSLSATADQRPSTAANSNPVYAKPAATGGGRVFALMVGIADYPGVPNDLSYTDEDAIKLSEALRGAGALADQSIVLTNDRATKVNVRAAFQRLAAQAGPNDTFLFFFSGHGAQTQSVASASEPDGRDESIALFDGLLSDDDVARLYGQVRAGTSIIALDSCFSGGFARDVVAMPGVMGLFASEEDLTSNVAFELKAGGYLSVFLRDGLSGEADGDRNGALTAGELSAYLHRRFASNVRDVVSHTSEGKRNYQFPVIERGGVGVDDLVLNIHG